MAVYKVIEQWSRSHTVQEIDSIHKKIEELLKKNKFVVIGYKDIKKTYAIYSEYLPSEEFTTHVIKRFIDEESALEYIQFVSNLDPISLTIEIEN